MVEVELAASALDTGTATFDGVSTYARVEDSNPSLVEDDGTLVKKTYAYFDFTKIPKGAVIVSVTVGFTVATAVEDDSPLYIWGLGRDSRDTDTDEELFLRIVGAAWPNDVANIPFTTGAKSVAFPQAFVNYLNALLVDSAIPTLGVGLCGQDDGTPIEGTIGDAWTLTVVCKSLDLQHPLSTGRMSTGRSTGRYAASQVDKAFPLLASRGTPLSRLLELVVNEQAANNTRVQQSGWWAFNRSESRGFSLEFESGHAHNGKGVIIDSVVPAQLVLLDNTAENYVQYDPDTGEVVVATDGFADGKLPLAYTPVEGAAVSPELRHDKRPLRFLLYGKKITPSNIADTVAAAIPSVDIAVGSESSNEVIVTLTLQDLSEDAIAQDQVFEAWLSEAPLATVDLDTDPDWITSTAASGGLAADTGTILETITTGKRLRGQFDAGEFELSITHTSAKTWYLNVLLNDRLYSSSAITFT